MVLKTRVEREIPSITIRVPNVYGLFIYFCRYDNIIVFDRLAGEQSVRDSVFFHIVLDTVHDHAVHLPRDIQRGQPTGEADPREDQLRSPDKLQPGDGREPAAVERRGQRFVVPDHVSAQRPSFDAVPGQQELHQNETGAQGGPDAGHHHGNVHCLLVAVFPVVSGCFRFDDSSRFSTGRQLERS